MLSVSRFLFNQNPCGGGGRSLKPGRSGFTVRVAVVIVRGNRILLGRHRKRGTDYWIVPGGRLEPGESLVQCGRREILEETGLQVDLGPLLYIGEFQGKGFRVLDFFFLGSSPDGDPVPGYDPEDSGPERVFQDLKWLSREELPSVRLLPGEAREAIVRDWPEGFRRHGLYIGFYTQEGKQHESQAHQEK